MDTAFATSAKSLLEQQLAITSKLVSTLQTEYNILKKVDTGDLAAISQEKQALIDQLEHLSQTWLKLLIDDKTEITAEGILSHLQNADPASELNLTGLWEELGSLAKECQRQNQINGAILVVRQQATQQTLDILRGVPSGQATYGPKGTTAQTPPPGLSIGKA